MAGFVQLELIWTILGNKTESFDLVENATFNIMTKVVESFDLVKKHLDLKKFDLANTSPS